jgi:hypothetical protein
MKGLHTEKQFSSCAGDYTYALERDQRQAKRKGAGSVRSLHDSADASSAAERCGSPAMKRPPPRAQPTRTPAGDRMPADSAEEAATAREDVLQTRISAVQLASVASMARRQSEERGASDTSELQGRRASRAPSTRQARASTSGREFETAEEHEERARRAHTRADAYHAQGYALRKQVGSSRPEICQ